MGNRNPIPRHIQKKIQADAVENEKRNTQLLPDSEQEKKMATERERELVNTAIKEYNLGNFLTSKGNLAGAKTHYEAAIAANPAHAGAHTLLGAILQTQGDLDGAKRHYEAAIAANPTEAGAHALLGAI